MSIERVIKRIADLKRDTAPNSVKMRTAMIRIGTVLESTIKLKIRSQRLIDTGRLLNSIHYKVLASGNSGIIEVGSYGVPYAALWEFGYHGVQSVGASTRNSKTGKSFGVRAHSRKVEYKARPYLKPSLDKQRQFIINMIRSIGPSP